MSASASARWSLEQEATLLTRMTEGATVCKVAEELGKSVANVQMKWSIIRPAVLKEEVSVACPNYYAELQAIKDAVAALEAKLLGQK